MNQRKRIARKTAYARNLLIFVRFELLHVNIENVAAKFLARGNSDDIDTSIYTAPDLTVKLMAMQLPNEVLRE